jgi:acyl-CoA thioesterase
MLFVEAKEVYLGNKTSVYEIKTTNETGALVALFKGTAYRTSRMVLNADNDNSNNHDTSISH